jgi:hypothetical protein
VPIGLGLPVAVRIGVIAERGRIDMFARKDDRIEVAMSADEVRDTVSCQKQQQEK